jgi:hypothetical protein
VVPRARSDGHYLFVTPVANFTLQASETVATEAAGRPAESPGGSDRFVNVPSFVEIIVIRFSFFFFLFFCGSCFFSLILFYYFR